MSTPADVRTAVVPVEMRKPTDDVSNFSSSDDGAGKVIYTKYYKKGTYGLAQEMSFGHFSLFWSLKKIHFKGNINSFLNSMLINFLVPIL